MRFARRPFYQKITEANWSLFPAKEDNTHLILVLVEVFIALLF